MWINIGPLKKYRNYRLLYFGQLISTLGSMFTYVALPYQIFKLTHSSLAVGMMGVIELAPLLVTALVGGAYADSMDRRKLLIYSELGLSMGSLLLAINAILEKPNIWLIYGVAALLSALNGFHRPALESLTPKLVDKQDLPAVSALGSLKGLTGTICAPALGGVLIAAYGLKFIYLIDFLSFGLSLVALLQIEMPAFKPEARVSPLKGIQEGFRYAWGRPELMGSYLVDFIAMILGMPTALFPAISEALGGARILGLLYAAPAAGALLAILLSGWTKKIYRSGAAITLSAIAWGIGITAFGFSHHLWLALFFLMVAGAADAMSGIFRMTLWNQTIPDRLRGRLAGVEMISYMSGPLLGNAESGLAAAAFGTQISVISGGILCTLGVGLCALFLPQFWRYKMPNSETSAEAPLGNFALGEE